MGAYRNLILGACFGLSMILGGFVGVYSTMPIIFALGPGYQSHIAVTGTTLGTIAGGIVWKVLARRFAPRALAAAAASDTQERSPDSAARTP